MCTYQQRPLRFFSSLLLSEGTPRVPRAGIEPRIYQLAGRRANHWATPHPQLNYASPPLSYASPHAKNPQNRSGIACGNLLPSFSQQIGLQKLINMPFERVECRIYELHATPMCFATRLRELKWSFLKYRPHIKICSPSAVPINIKALQSIPLLDPSKLVRRYL